VQVEGANPEHIVSLSSDFLTDDRLNRIHALIRQAVLSNPASYLTDCPTREKIGWLEQTFLTADAVLPNIDAAPLYEKIVAGISNAQLASGMLPSFAPGYQRFADAHDVDNDLRNISSPRDPCTHRISPPGTNRAHTRTMPAGTLPQPPTRDRRSVSLCAQSHSGHDTLLKRKWCRKK